MEAVEVRSPEPPEAVPAAETSLSTTDFAECYVLHYNRLVRALRLGGADAASAEDVAQEAFARAFGRWKRVSKGTNPAGYVYVTGFRLLQRSLRRESRWDVGEMPDQPMIRSMYGQAADTATTATLNVALEAVLARMPPRRRACAVMCLVVGLPVNEAGEALGIADGTVRKHLEEARKDFGSLAGD
jgi:RNA polymerase sigma-70 factor (ECF subfamily)